MIFLFYLFTTLTMGSEVCNRSNYRKFIHDEKKTIRLVKETGKGCQLKGIYLGSSLDLKKTYFYNADLKKARIENNDLTGTKFDNADMRGAVLKNLALSRVSFCGVDFSKGKILKGESRYLLNANGARFDTADISGANLLGMSVLGIVLNGIEFDSETEIRLPEHQLLFSHLRDGKPCKTDNL